jgi:hypothetical protein
LVAAGFAFLVHLKINKAPRERGTTVRINCGHWLHWFSLAIVREGPIVRRVGKGMKKSRFVNWFHHDNMICDGFDWFNFEDGVSGFGASYVQNRSILINSEVKGCVEE